MATIETQAEIKWFMRPYLLDFLTEAHGAFALLPETLFLTVNILDRYCAKRVVYKRHYQLVGCASLLIAAKYGDHKERVPTIRELGNMCCSLYDDEMFTQMEWHVLQTLGWVIGHPTIDSFLQIALDGVLCDAEVEHLACYISEIALFHKEFVGKRPSDMARASLALSRIILGRPQARRCDWAADYDPATLVSLSQHLHRPSQVLSRKYASIHLSRVSITLEDFLTQHAAIARSYAAPPTPPCEVLSPIADQTIDANSNHFRTPQKPKYGVNMPHGCLTPPETPTDDCFAGPNPGLRCPTTPTPLGGQPPSHQYHSRYQPSSIM